MALGKTVFFKKLIDGGVSLYLSDVEGVLPPRWFAMDHKVPRIGVPENYALSLFLDANIDKAFKRKLFEVEKIEDLIKVAQERGYVALSPEETQVIVEPSRSKEILLSILKGGNKEKIAALFASADRNRALEIAVSNAKSFSMETIQTIEEILGMAITEE